MSEKNDWKVSIVRDREHQELWIATATRDDFDFTQKVAANDGEITSFCKTARTMFKQHVADKARAAQLADHFDEILESEDQRELDEAAAAAEEKAKADAEAAALAAKPIETPPAPPTEPPVEPSPDAPVAETPSPEGSNEKSV